MARHHKNSHNRAHHGGFNNSVQTAEHGVDVKAVNPHVGHSIFNIRQTNITTHNASFIYPIFHQEILPSDSINDFSIHAILRLTNPQLHPVMDDLHIDIMAYFVPNRLVMYRWTQVMGENPNGIWDDNKNNLPLVPVHAPAQVVLNKSLSSYYGIPVGMSTTDVPPTSLLERGYVLIWNEWWRDQTTQTAKPTLFDADFDPSNLTYSINAPLLRANKKHDAFTTALPSPQKGDSPIVGILDALVPVRTGNTDHNLAQGALRMRDSISNIPTNPFQMYVQGNGTQNADVRRDNTVATVTQGNQLTPANLYADFSNATNYLTIDQLRFLFQQQRYLEKDARGGTRYREWLHTHYGIVIDEYMVQIPKFLGYITSEVGVYQVAQTSGSGSYTGTPQGTLTSFGYLEINKHLFKHSFIEHGYLHVMAVIRRRPTYQQRLEKTRTRRERYDYYDPEFAHIGEQPMYNYEINANAPSAVLNEVFGYQEPFWDYRMFINRVGGDMYSGAVNTLDEYHYADYYGTNQVFLSDVWKQDNTLELLDRTLSITSAVNDQFVMDYRFTIQIKRDMPVYSIPGLIDHTYGGGYQ